MYAQAVKKINWQVPEDLVELDSRKNIFHERYMKLITLVNDKENDAKQLKN